MSNHRSKLNRAKFNPHNFTGEVKKQIQHAGGDPELRGAASLVERLKITTMERTK